uniref:Uncharacterized protein n=1 Tax=Poecilia reticulata TaxID=8081 RepID=A0A3P9NMT7_POERE
MTSLPPISCPCTQPSDESISWGSVKRSMASRTMVKHSAVRKIALTRAPITSARIHPNVFFLVEWVLSANRTATRATTSAKTSDSIWKESESIERDEVMRLTTTSTTKKPKVSASIHSNRARLGPQAIFASW